MRRDRNDRHRVSPKAARAIHGKALSNLILLSLSDAEFEIVRPHMEFVQLPQNLTLHEPSEKLKFAYFVNHGLVSVVVAMRAGKDVEAGVIGFEGVAGTALAVGLNRSPLRQIVQIAGDGFRISAPALESLLKRMPDVRIGLSRYAVLQGMQVAQTAACNRLHDLSERLARWLLMAQDRVKSGVLPITQEFLSVMLGTDRPTVSLAAASLQKNKAISYRRGAVKILSRTRLERSACSCYPMINRINREMGLS